jgi:hypothetical protein
MELWSFRDAQSLQEALCKLGLAKLSKVRFNLSCAPSKECLSHIPNCRERGYSWLTSELVLARVSTVEAVEVVQQLS